MALLQDHPELAGQWPPQPAEIFSGYGFYDPRPEEIVLLSVVPEDDSATVTFHGKHQRGGCRYRLETSSEEFAALLRSWLNRHLGKTLQDLGSMEIEE
jgi:hypothetical protein